MHVGRRQGRRRDPLHRLLQGIAGKDQEHLAAGNAPGRLRRHARQVLARLEAAVVVCH